MNEKLRKIKSSELPAFLNITPTSDAPTWALSGNFQTEGDRAYEATETEESYINEDGPTTDVESYKVSLDNEMKCVKGDAVFDYIDNLRYTLATGTDAESQVLLVDKYSYVEEESVIKYRAQLFKCSISISKQGRTGGETSTIAYKINCNGDPKNGTVTITAGVPTFTENAPATANAS